MPSEVALKGAIGSHQTPIVDKPWNGPQAESRLRNGEVAAYYKRAYTWFDSSADIETKAAYALPHHEVDADGSVGAANVKGVQAALAALNGARGGVDLPQADRRAVHRHLASHMKDAGLEAVPLSATRSFSGGDTVETQVIQLQITSKYFEAVTKGDGLDFFVKGFASMEGVDRDGDDIPAAAFDIETFKANPQLWFNHRLFENSKGIEVPIGTVEDIFVAQVIKRENSNVFDVVDLKSGSTIDSFDDSSKFVIKDKDRGLWVTVKVIEEDIQELERSGTPISSLETGTPITEFHVIAFSVAFEMDYPNVLKVLELARIPLRAEDRVSAEGRNSSYPLITMGGICAFSNPEPMALFMDACFIGEAEAVLPEFLEAVRAGDKREGNPQLFR